MPTIVMASSSSRSSHTGSGLLIIASVIACGRHRPVAAAAAGATATASPMCAHTAVPGVLPFSIDWPVEQHGVAAVLNRTNAASPGVISPEGCARACCGTAGCVLWTFQADNRVGRGELFGDSPTSRCQVGAECCVLQNAGSWPANASRLIQAHNKSTVSGTAQPWVSPGFAATFSDHQVLQRAPQRAAVYGMSEPGSEVEVAVAGTGPGGEAASVPALRATAGGNGHWKAFFSPLPAGGNYTLTFRCAEGCPARVFIEQHTRLLDVTFGDVVSWAPDFGARKRCRCHCWHHWQ